MLKNLYQILEISSDASIEEIKKSYRRLAVVYHPDKHVDSIDSSDFVTLTEAYNVLSDEEKRKNYDKTKFKIEKLNKKGSDLRITINVHSCDLINNKNKLITLKRYGSCPICSGTGSEIKKTFKCSDCYGSGLQGFMLIMGYKKRCKTCQGSGHIPEKPLCNHCLGKSLCYENINYELNLNPLIEHYVIPKLGNYGPYNGEPGNLIIDLDIKEDPIYKLMGINIKGPIYISPVQAVLGCGLNLSILGKRINLIVPSGTQQNDIIRCIGGGSYHKGKYGDFIGSVIISIPKIITEKEKEIYEQLLKIEGEIACPITLKL